MRFAYELASASLPEFRNKFSRQDFTLAQLFACLVLREHSKLTYRRLVALLRDTDWCQRIGMNRVPSTATLCRAFHFIMKPRALETALDLLVEVAKRMELTGKTLAIDSTLYDTHHFTRHYDYRRSKHAGGDKTVISKRKSETMKQMPKLAVGCDTGSHLITSMLTHTGGRSDAPDFVDLSMHAYVRCCFDVVLADAGYDSAENHAFARRILLARSWIKARVGRPTDKPPNNKYRREMSEELKGTQAGQPYGQRAQVETTISMIKRNLGGHLRCKTSLAREMEMRLRCVVHNLMVV